MPEKLEKGIPPQYVGERTLCKFFQLSSPHLHNMVKAGMPKVAHGTYPLQLCTVWLLDHYRQAAPKRRESDSTEQARKMLYEEQTEKYKLENAVRRGELIELEDVRQFLLLLATTVAARLEGLPARLTHSPEQREKLLDECRTVRTEVARALEDCSLIQDTVEGADAPTDTQRGPVGGSTPDNASGDTDSRAVA